MAELLKTVLCFYVDRRACVEVGMDVSEWFPIIVGLRQGCVRSPWLFNMTSHNLRANGVWFEKNQLSYADDTALVADAEENLCKFVSKFGRLCERRKFSECR